MANGAYEELRATAAVANGAIAEAAPAAGAMDKTFGRIVRSIEVRLAALVTSGTPTAVTGTIYIRRTGGTVVPWLTVVIPVATDAISGTPPIIQLPDCYAEAVSWKFASFTAGTVPAIVSFDFDVAVLDP